MSTKKKTSKKEADSMFVGVPDPANLKTTILQTSKDFLLILKAIEELKQIRTQKQESLNKIVELIQEIKTLINKLKRKLPSTTILKTHKDKIKTVPAKTKPTVSKTAKKSIPSKTEIQKLEEELATIESKLGSM